MSTNRLSKSQIDKLGERLQREGIDEADLRLLDMYRRSFGDAYEAVVGAIRDRLSLEPTGRPAKSTDAIADKLRRESIRLTQIQDIAGCRLIVADVREQDRTVRTLRRLFQQFPAVVVDRRHRPSHGYRAVHMIVTIDGKPVEIQVRTALQHRWAEMSEKSSDVIDRSIKYGGGEESITSKLDDTSRRIEEIEAAQMRNKMPAGVVSDRVKLIEELDRMMVILSHLQRTER